MRHNRHLLRCLGVVLAGVLLLTSGVRAGALLFSPAH